MAKKRYRDFLRISMTAKTALWIEKNLIDKTLKDHYDKCADPTLGCHHQTSHSLAVARLLESGLKIGKKRATLDLPCPYSTETPRVQCAHYASAARRIISFSTKEKKQLRAACVRICAEITIYANRNAMQVIAEAAL